MNQGTVSGSSQGPERERAPDAIREAFETMQKLEPNMVALDPARVTTSVAISLKRIADQLTVIAGNTSGLSYDSSRSRDALREDFNKLAEAYKQATQGPMGPR